MNKQDKKQALFSRMVEIGTWLSLAIAYLFILIAAGALFGGSFK